MNTNDRTGSNFLPGPDCFEITDEKFKELFDGYSKMIEETSIGHDFVMPCVSLHFRQLKDGMPGDVEGALIGIDADFNEADDKQAILEKLGAQCLAKQWILVCAFMSSEAWQSTRDIKDPQPDMRPRDDPNRQECIIIAGRTLMGECKRACMIPVGRDKDNKFIKSGDVIFTNDIETFLLDHIFIGFNNAISAHFGGR